MRNSSYLDQEADLVKHLEETPLLDFGHPDIAALVEQRGWRRLDPYEAIGSIYDFVRNEVRFGYNASDDLPASSVLQDGYGQCNTKGTTRPGLASRHGPPPAANVDFNKETTRPHHRPPTRVRSLLRLIRSHSGPTGSWASRLGAGIDSAFPVRRQRNAVGW